MMLEASLSYFVTSLPVRKPARHQIPILIHRLQISLGLVSPRQYPSLHRSTLRWCQLCVRCLLIRPHCSPVHWQLWSLRTLLQRLQISLGLWIPRQYPSIYKSTLRRCQLCLMVCRLALQSSCRIGNPVHCSPARVPQAGGGPISCTIRKTGQIIRWAGITTGVPKLIEINEN